MTTALAHPNERPEAAAALRILIDRIVLTPAQSREKSTPRAHDELRTILQETGHQIIGNGCKNKKLPEQSSQEFLFGCGGRI